MQFDPSPEDVRAELERILASTSFQNAERASRFLRFVVERALRGGAPELKEYLIGVEVFGRRQNFDPRLDPIVRAEAARLRTRLQEFYSDHGRDGTVIIDLPKGTYAPVFSLRLPETDLSKGSAALGVEPTRAQELSSTGTPSARWAVLRVILASVIVLAAGFAIGRRWEVTSDSSGPLYQQLTSEGGLALDAAISPDGKLVAYGSDRDSPSGELHLWVQQVSGGSAVRITQGDQDDYQPAFSPDATLIAFRSERYGGGIYIMPSLGGEPKKLAAGGYDPRFSPDGKTVLYWTGEKNSGEAFATDASRLFMVDAQGGAPRRFQPDFTGRFPIWSADGTHVLFVGRDNRKKFVAGSQNWWVASVTGGEPVELDIHRLPATAAGDVTVFEPTGWLSGNRILFRGHSGDSSNLWEVHLDRQFRAVAAPRRLTSGATFEQHHSTAESGDTVFTVAHQIVSIWALPLDADRGVPRGQPYRITDASSVDRAPALSADGRYLAYSRDVPSNQNVYYKDLITGISRPLTIGSNHALLLTLSIDGSKVVYGNRELRAGGQMNSLYVVDARGGAPSEQLCSSCGRPWSISPDSKWLSYGPIPYNAIKLMDLATKRSSDLITHSSYSLYEASFAPDGRWLAFVARVASNRSRIFIARFRPGDPIPEKEWTPVVTADTWNDKPRFSPNGELLFFTSDRDGYRCIWAQRLDGARHASGDAFAVRHYHNARTALSNLGRSGSFEISVAADKAVYSLMETTSSEAWVTHLR